MINGKLKMLIDCSDGWKEKMTKGHDNCLKAKIFLRTQELPKGKKN